MRDLLELTAELVDIPSVSRDERAIADHLEASLRDVPWLTVDRVGDNVVARTELGRAERLLLVGHTDTVPVNENSDARIDGDVLHGLDAVPAGVDLAVTALRAADGGVAVSLRNGGRHGNVSLIACRTADATSAAYSQKMVGSL